MKNSFKIGRRNVSADGRCYVIAEAGSNHNRDMKTALGLIDCAAHAGADAVKFQTFSAEKIASSKLSQFTKLNFAGSKSLFELYKKCELPRSWQKELYDYSREKGITFLSTPFDEKAADELHNINIDVYKIASFEIHHFPLLKHIAQFGKPVLLSTGMATIGEIEEAVEVLETAGCNEIGLFHCGIGYPMNPAEVNLKAMDTMAKVFPCPVGYSDHTLGISVPTAAVARGASLIEKHFTLDKTLPGPDHAFALDGGELKNMVKSIRTVQKCLGSSKKEPVSSELIHKKRGRRSLHAGVVIKKGTKIKKNMIEVLRPSSGLHPRYLEVIIGKRTSCDIGKSEPITWNCFTN